MPSAAQTDKPMKRSFRLSTYQGKPVEASVVEEIETQEGNAVPMLFMGNSRGKCLCLEAETEPIFEE
jgi:hypothetical protein